ncbi:MAG: hypothetical protein JG777_155 [Clostridia bacterium]|jgi:hypothetical protein|nr:hypothetical protein [Clostridia bacterium]
MGRVKDQLIEDWENGDIDDNLYLLDYDYNKDVKLTNYNNYQYPMNGHALVNSYQKDSLIAQSFNPKSVYHIATKIVGVTFQNEDGSSRQNLVTNLISNEVLQLVRSTFNGEPAIAVCNKSGKKLGHLKKELVNELISKYGERKMTAFVSEVTGRQYGKTLGCNIDIYIDTESLKNENSLKKDTQQQVPIQKSANDSVFTSYSPSHRSNTYGSNPTAPSYQSNLSGRKLVFGLLITILFLWIIVKLSLSDIGEVPGKTVNIKEEPTYIVKETTLPEQNDTSTINVYGKEIILKNSSISEYPVVLEDGYLDLVEITPNNMIPIGMVNSQGLNFREDHNTRSHIIKVLFQDEKLQIYGEYKGWYFCSAVVNKEPIYGWCSKNYIVLENIDIINNAISKNTPTAENSQISSAEGHTVQDDRFFSLGSKDTEVKSIMGTPTKIDNYTYWEDWYYKDSMIKIANQKVVGWDNKGNLKVFIGSKEANAPAITLDSTAEDVIKAAGTPKKIDNYTYWEDWYYKDSTIKIVNNKVVGWDNRGNLDIFIGSKEPNAPAITLNSTIKDVIKAKGTPTKIDYYTYWEDWYYNNVSYKIENGKVTEIN